MVTGTPLMRLNRAGVVARKHPLTQLRSTLAQVKTRYGG
jgi:hypothetical protein